MRAPFVATALVWVLPGLASAQSGDGLKEICLSLTNNNLIDQYDMNSAIDRQSQEFRRVCSKDTDYKNRFEQMSAAAQASFFGYGGGSASGGKTTSATEFQIKEKCEQGEAAFRDRAQTMVTASSGRNVANLIVQCAQIYSTNEAERLTGWTDTADNDLGFGVYIQSVTRDNAIYKLESAPPDTTCSRPVGTPLPPNSEIFMFCKKPYGESMRGGFTFVKPSGQKKVVMFSATSRNREREIDKEVKDRLRSEVVAFRKELLERTSYRIIMVGSYSCPAPGEHGMTVEKNFKWMPVGTCFKTIDLPKVADPKKYQVLTSVSQLHTNDTPALTLRTSNPTPYSFSITVEMTSGQLSSLDIDYVVIENDS